MRIVDWIIVLLAVFGLIGVRFVEEKIFYDPFLDFFHEANKKANFPDFLWTKLILNYLFRFVLNLLLSVTIIYFIFKRKDWAIQAALLILLVFAITFPIYLYCIYTQFDTGYLFSFYMRRFVIQPLILLLIIPLFYYRKQILTQKNPS